MKKIFWLIALTIPLLNSCIFSRCPGPKNTQKMLKSVQKKPHAQKMKSVKKQTICKKW
jgi:hypothetical protein